MGKIYFVKWCKIKDKQKNRRNLYFDQAMISILWFISVWCLVNYCGKYCNKYYLQNQD